jgi:hypothetical protein
MFLNYVDTFTEWHLKLLRLFQNPPAPPNLSGGLSHVLELVYPELKGQRQFYDSIWRELYQRSLVNSDTLHVTVTASGLAQRRTTSLGDKFLSFVTMPAGTPHPTAG